MLVLHSFSLSYSVFLSRSFYPHFSVSMYQEGFCFMFPLTPPPYRRRVSRLLLTLPT